MGRNPCTRDSSKDLIVLNNISYRTNSFLMCLGPIFTGAAMFGPMVNPYQSGMTKEEVSGAWEKWMRRRKLMYYLARRFPKFLSYFYRRTFLSGKHGQIDKWLSLSLGKKVSSFPSGIYKE